MKVTTDEVLRIARLAHIELAGTGEQDLERARGQLEQILTYVEKLNELDTTHVAPAIGVAAGITGPAREDHPQGTLPEEEALANAPEAGRGHFKVPRVIA